MLHPNQEEEKKPDSLAEHRHTETPKKPNKPQQQKVCNDRFMITQLAYKTFFFLILTLHQLYPHINHTLVVYFLCICIKATIRTEVFLLGETKVKHFSQIFGFIQQSHQSPKGLLLPQLHQQHCCYVGHPCKMHTHFFLDEAQGKRSH